MQPSDRRWTVACAACEIVVGFVEGGRFVHDPTCARPLAIARGTMRCCRCSGRLTLAEMTGEPLDRSDPEEPPRLQDLAAQLNVHRARGAHQRR